MESELHSAVVAGNIAYIKRVLATPGTDVNKIDEDGTTALILAAEHGHPAMLYM